MRNAALLISVGLLIGAGSAFAQTAETAAQPAAPAASAAQIPAAASAPSAPQAPAVQTPAPGQQAADQACAPDVQKFCSGKDGAERSQCLNENRASLAAACRATLSGAAGAPIRN